MTVKFTQERADSLRQSYHNLLQLQCPTVRDVAEIQGENRCKIPSLTVPRLEREKTEARALFIHAEPHATVKRNTCPYGSRRY